MGSKSSQIDQLSENSFADTPPASATQIFSNSAKKPKLLFLYIGKGCAYSHQKDPCPSGSLLRVPEITLRAKETSQ
jgi:hypothetical protein